MVLCFQLVEVISQVSKRCKSESKPPCEHTQKANKSTGVFLGFFRKIHGLSFLVNHQMPIFHIRIFQLRKEICFSSLQGRAVLVANVASRWGFTKKHYKELIDFRPIFHPRRPWRDATKSRTLKEQVLAVKRITSTHVKRCTKNFCFSFFQCWVCSSFVSRRLVTRVVSFPTTCRKPPTNKPV